jgi:multiple sugar transport system substrate-binding protein
MKKFFVLLVILFLSLSVAACRKDDEAGDRITIQYWHMNPVGSPGFSETRAIINAFNERQDDYFVRGTGFSFWDYWDKINIAVSSSTAPDIGFSTIDDVVARAENGVLYNISDLIESDTSENNIDLSEFRQSQLDFATYEGDLWAMPFSATTRALFYNLDMFADEGLTEADVPTTWSELHETAKKFDVVEGGQIQRIGFDPTYGNATYHGWLWQKGLDFFDEDLNPTLNTQEHVDVLEWIIDFNDDFTRSQLTAFGEANQMLGINAFAAERVAMIVDTDGLYQAIIQAGATFNYGVAPIPVPDEDGLRVSWGSGFSLEMYDNNKDDEARKQGAWAFYKYLFEVDTQMLLAESNGWIMSHVSAMETYAADKPILQKLLVEMDYAIDKVFVPYAPSWHGNDWQPFYTQALDGTLSPAQALEAARAHYLQKKENWEDTN